MDKDRILHCMKAFSIPAGFSGLWYINKLKTTQPITAPRRGRPVVVDPGEYTYLYRITDLTVYHYLAGEIVMEDTPFELATHLNFILRAHGKILITGLGLGCVIRGLLQNPDVEHITCIENSKDVLHLVQPYMPTTRLTIIEADALKWTSKNKEHFDYAWHDLWTDRDSGQPHLDIWHAELINNCQAFIKHQGAWAFSRQGKQLLIRRGFPWIG